MAGTTTCRTCGQANAEGTEYCVRCGERMPDPSTTQLVGAPGGEQEYPWEPPAEWDPGELPQTGDQQGRPATQPPAPTWVGRGGDQVGWNTGHDTGAGQQSGPPWGGQPLPTQPGRSGGGSKKPLIFGVGAVVIIAAIIAVVLVATGGKSKKGGGGTALNGVQNENGTDALTSARVALRGAKSTHLTGTVTSNGQKIQLDLTLVGSNSQGTLTINNNDVQLIKLDNAVFIKGDPDFLKQYAKGNTAAVTQLNGKWLKTATTSDFDQFSIDGFANVLKASSGGPTINAKVTQSTLNAKPVVILSESDGSTLTVANTGEPFPLVLDSKGSSGGQVSFSDYNKAVTITAPASSDVLDLSQTATPTPSASPSGNLLGAYKCTPDAGGTGGGTLTLNADKSYTLSSGTGGSWGSSGDQVAFAGGGIDKFAATFDGVQSLLLRGTGTNSAVTYTCIKP